MSDNVAQNREAQRAAYGEPLGETFTRIQQALGLNQAKLAEVLGLSAPMLSQLNSARRVKIGNPAVVARVQQLNELVDQRAAGQLEDDDVPKLLEQVRNSQATLGQTTRSTAAQAPDEVVVAGIRSLLRAVASGAALRNAADELADKHPELAEVLRLYGTGQADPAVEHYAKHKNYF